VNTRLSETAFAEHFNISRKPLRQAMAKLVEEHLLEKIEKGGCRVASFSVEDIFDAVELRGMLESTAARLAAERGSDPDLLTEAESIHQKLDHPVSASGQINFAADVELNDRLHQIIAGLAKPRVMERELERMTQ